LQRDYQTSLGRSLASVANRNILRSGAMGQHTQEALDELGRSRFTATQDLLDKLGTARTDYLNQNVTLEGQRATAVKDALEALVGQINAGLVGGTSTARGGAAGGTAASGAAAGAGATNAAPRGAPGPLSGSRLATLPSDHPLAQPLARTTDPMGGELAIRPGPVQPMANPVYPSLTQTPSDRPAVSTLPRTTGPMVGAKTVTPSTPPTSTYVSPMRAPKLTSAAPRLGQTMARAA